MKKLFIANWKSHKTTTEALEFLTALKKEINGFNLDDKEIIICPSFTLLHSCFEFIQKNTLSISLGAQNISSFPEGAYNGEVCGKQIKEYADYVIIGHSERKRYQNETEEDIEMKVKQARAENLKIILCVQDENGSVIPGADYIAYEPPSAISTFGVGKPDDPERVAHVFSIISKKTKTPLLYGGSVSEQTVSSYMGIDQLEGFLIGGASLSPLSLAALLLKC